MAHWREHLRKASFRGVPYEVGSRKGKGGRRGPDHEYAKRDEGFPEDLGAKIKRYSVVGFIFGPDYLDAKNRLIEALDKEGPGEYIDLWGDTWQVQVRDYEWEEKASEGGYVAFGIDFVAAGNKPLHTVKADTAYAVQMAGADAKTSLVEDFGTTFDAEGDDLVLDDALAMATDALDSVAEVMAQPRRLATMAVSRVVGVLANITRLRGGLLGLMANPFGFASSLRSLLASALAGLSPADRYKAARSFSGYGASYPTSAISTSAASYSPARAQAVANRAAMVNLVRGLAAVEAAEAASEMDFPIYDDAVAIRQDVADELDARMMDAPDTTYRALSRVRAASVRDITERGADRARLTEVTLGADTPALVLAHRLYGDASREDLVLSRNRVIRHPGFVPGGKLLKVPTNV